MSHTQPLTRSTMGNLLTVVLLACVIGSAQAQAEDWAGWQAFQCFPTPEEGLYSDADTCRYSTCMQAITDFHDGGPFPAGSPELHIFCDAVTGRCKWCEQMSGPPDHARSECHFCPQPRPCAVGQYSDTGRDESGRKACQPCPSGRTNARAGSTKCDVAAQVSIPQYTNISRIAKMLGTSWAGAGYDSSGEAHYLYRPDGDFTGARRAPGTLDQRSHACGRRSGSRPRIIAMRAVCVAPSVAGRHSYQPPPPPPLLRARCAACACRVRVPTGRGLFALTCAHPRPSSSSGCVVGQSKIVHPGQGGRPSAWWSSCCWT